jgi:hypothetical protein
MKVTLTTSKIVLAAAIVSAMLGACQKKDMYGNGKSPTTGPATTDTPTSSTTPAPDSATAPATPGTTSGAPGAGAPGTTPAGKDVTPGTNK